MKKRASLPRPDRQSLPSATEAKFVLDYPYNNEPSANDFHPNFELVEICGEVFLVAFGRVVGWYPRGCDGEMSVIAICSNSIGQFCFGLECPRYVPKCGILWFPANGISFSGRVGTSPPACG